MDTVKTLGVKTDQLGLDYFIPENEEVEKDWIPESFQQGYVVFAIGGQHNTKKLPLARMIELCDRINKPVILIGGKQDISTGEKIESFFNKNLEEEHFEEGLQELGKKTFIYNACGKFTINQSASIIKKADYVFTHDTGMMHIASAFKKQVYSIWGNTIPLFGMYPYKTKFVVFENNALNCRPCSKIGYKKCPKGHFKCMKEVVFDFYLP
jgi:ADP-heptose:LPS heptosyltransferase